MREILFRGKTTNNGKWVYGYIDYNFNTKIAFMRTPKHIYTDVDMVIPETVGQYTGITDKNGKKIFEGDIVKNDWCFMKGNSIIRFGEYKSFDMSNDFRQGHLGFYIEALSESKKMLYRKDILYYADKCEVIGNVFDNPELLKGEGKE